MLIFGLFLGLVFSACKIPVQPEFKGISEFRLNGKNNGKPMGFAVGLEVFNPNAFKIKLKGYELDVTINGRSLGHASSKEKQVMLPEASTNLNFIIDSDIKQVFHSLFGALKGLLGKEHNVDVNVKGFVIGKAHGIRKKIPVDFTRTVNLNDE